VAPRDETLFGAQDFAFIEANQSSVTELLALALPDGGANGFWNLSSCDVPATRDAQSRVWMRGLGHFLDSGRDNAAPGLRVNWGGLEAGADVAIGEGARLGGGRASQKIFRVSLYGSQTLGAVGLSAAFSYAHGWDNDSRASGFGPSLATRSVNEWTGAVQAAAPLASGGVSITPAAGVLISGVSGGAFSETNPLSAAFAVTGNDHSRTLVSPYAVVGVSHAFTSGDGMVVAPGIQVGYRYDAAAQGGRVTLVAPDGTVFDNIQFERNRNSALVGASVTASQGRWTGFVKYRASLSSNWTDEAVEAGFRLGF
jgi:hypothetical protein